MNKIYLVLFLIFVLGCVQVKDFEYALEQINKINLKYKTSMDTYPKSINEIDFMLNELMELKKIQLGGGVEPFNYVLNYRILNLEAEKFYILGQRYGSAGTTKDGFGCKSRPLIIESAHYRNASSQKGFEAVNLLREFINNYPEEANLSNLSEKNALFLNASFYNIYIDARRDSGVINRFCSENKTLEIYKQDFMKTTELSEEFINNLTYEQAVDIWKELRGIN
ncbi:hypothetical protein HYW99_00755 [Candidatus Woesearchaeota archaeon]|nr:hypothetical protein [Candidatus Woesearchaeota archaeon]